mmetsp:Transcript_8914/g.16151  ORF Transcript_8914/g.16151 Transcript_8914/m.16151 type:complete len:218 (+) Transcript_8914:2376-3029(+)
MASRRFLAWIRSFVSEVRKVANVGNDSADSSGSSHTWRHEVSASSITLATFKVTVGRRRTTFLGLEFVGIHRKTHGAAWFSPIEPSLDENFVESFVLCLLFDKTRSRNDHGMYTIRNLASHSNCGNRTNIFNATIRARTDKNFFNWNALDLLSFLESNVLQRTLNGSLTSSIVSLSSNHWYVSSDRTNILRTCSPGDGRRNVFGINNDSSIVNSILI